MNAVYLHTLGIRPYLGCCIRSEKNEQFKIFNTLEACTDEKKRAKHSLMHTLDLGSWQGGVAGFAETLG